MRRLCPLPLTLALLVASGCSVGNTLYDFDGDGVQDADDCDPADPDIHPGSTDPVGDGVDQNCDGIDGIDFDGDGFASVETGGDDCNDSSPAIHPDAIEDCFNQIDDDCDGQQDAEDDECGGGDDDSAGDDDSSVEPADADNDGWDELEDCDDNDASLNLDDSDADGVDTCGGDCDDSDASNFPGNSELCDGKDNDCIGGPDFLGGEADLDGDTYLSCNDCDDNDPAVNPSVAEVCGDGIDNDCDGLTDSGLDLDSDGVPGLPCGDDCNDSDDTVYPGATESCDSSDSNCDGSLIDGFDNYDGDTEPDCIDDGDADGLTDAQELLAGTNPAIADTDGDGALDGDEVAAGSGPLNPADLPGLLPLTPDVELDLESDDGGLATSGSLWDYGVVTNGPGHGHTGARAWATSVSGNYTDNAVEYLYLPPIDLGLASDPTLSFRLWMRPWGAADGVSLEVDSGSGWGPLVPDLLAYNGTAAGNVPSWTSIGYQDQYRLAAVSLASFVGQVIEVRWVFRSSPTLVSSGAYIDDIGLHEEGSDPDGDSIAGILDEYDAHGTDPLLADTDGDGTSDGDEVAAGTVPLNPADFPGITPLTPDVEFDLESNDGGLATSGSLWDYGVVTNGPGHGHTGTRAWATNVSGNYTDSAVEYLYLPPIDLGLASDPTLSFRLWMRPWGAADGVSLEVDSGSGWGPLVPDLLAYNGTAAGNVPSWTSIGYQDQYRLAAASLASFVGQVIAVRWVFRSSPTLVSSGAYIDDIGLHEESSDLDGDSIAGILDEYDAHGTDPMLADTDGDGASDGDEAANATDPLNPAALPGGPTLQTGVLYDFETGPQGLATSGSLWALGAPTSGPNQAYSGYGAWATNPGGDYSVNADEALYFPILDLSSTTSPSLRFQLWMDTWGSGDGLTFEVETSALGWVTVSTVSPAYDGSNSTGQSAWANTAGNYVPVDVDLSTWNGQQLPARLRFRSSNTLNDDGAYIDDVELIDN